MARHVGRSRGCKTCLQRKIKCDEKLPECTQCVTQGQNCPGPTVGAVFIAMQPKAKKQAGNKNVSGSRSQNPPRISSDGAKNGHAESISGIVSTDSSEGNQHAVGLYGQFLLPSSYHPSRKAPFQQLFLGHFISSFDNENLHRTPMKSWYKELPSILSASSFKAGQEAIRAATIMHYGVMTANVSIQTEGCRWYARALRGQRIDLQNERPALSTRMPTGEEVLSLVILSIFELVSSTTPMGWIDHLLAAAALLQMRKPENCQNGLVHLVFRTMRMTVVYVTMTTEKQHIFATYPWSTVPFAIHPKTINDRLIDILLLIPGCLSIYNQITSTSGLDIQHEPTLRLELEFRASSQLECLHDWWQEYADGVAIQSGKDASLLYGLGGETHPSKPNEPYFADAFTAACAASYHAANIILYSMLSFTSSQPYYYGSAIESHTSEILAACSYMIAHGSCSAGTLMMVFPLKIVCHWALEEPARQSAFEFLELWGRMKGVEGICTQAAPLYEIPAMLAARRACHISS